MEDTLVVSKIPLGPPPRPRRVTTQFAPERRARVWPWVLGMLLLVAAVARPIDPTAEVERSSRAQEVLRALPSQ